MNSRVSNLIVNKTNCRNLTLLLSSAMTLIAGATISSALPDISLYFKNIPNTQFWVQFIITIPPFFIAISSPFLGCILDKFGRKPVLIIGILLYAIAGSIGYFIESLWLLLLSRAFVGIGFAAVMTSCTTLIGDFYKDEELNKYLGAQAAFMGFAGVLLLILGGFLNDINWRFTFLINLCYFIVLPGVFLFVEEPMRIKQKHSGLSFKADHLYVSKLLIIYLIGFLMMMVLYIIPVVLPFFIKLFKNTHNIHTGIAVAILIFFAGITSSYYKRVRLLMNYKYVFVLAFTLIGIGYLVVAISTSYYIMLPGLILIGLGQGFTLPNINFWIISTTEEFIRGKAIGFLTTFLYLGQFSTALITYPVQKIFDLVGCFIMATLIMLVLAIGFILFNKNLSTNK